MSKKKYNIINMINDYDVGFQINSQINLNEGVDLKLFINKHIIFVTF